MMLLQTEYTAVRDRIRPGDIIAFSGSGFVSWAIKRFTRSVLSHVGIVYEHRIDDKRRVKLMESTSLNGMSGVQETFLSERLETYDGAMWWLPLSDRTRRKMDQTRFWYTLTQCNKQKIKYDYRQVGHFVLDPLHLWAQGEDTGRLFCSELCALALKNAFILPVWIDSSEVRPCDLAAFRIYSENYYQLRGELTPIKGYNSKEPDKWRNG